MQGSAMALARRNRIYPFQGLSTFVSPVPRDAASAPPALSPVTRTTNNSSYFQSANFVVTAQPVPLPSCSLHKHPEAPNEENEYGQNFDGKFCLCGRPHDAESERETMIQCLV